MDKKKYLEGLQNYQKRVEEWFGFIKSKKGTEFNKEQNTLIKFVVPLFQILGWCPFSVDPADMEFEYYIRDKSTNRRRSVDIALYSGNAKTPKFLVEIKPIQDKDKIDKLGKTKLEKAAGQLYKYYFKNSNVVYGIVTNGAELKVYSKRFVTEKSGRARELFSLRYKDFVDYSDILSVLSKEKVEADEFDRLAKAYQTKQYADWKKSSKTGDSEHDDYILPLKFVRNFLSGKI